MTTEQREEIRQKAEQQLFEAKTVPSLICVEHGKAGLRDGYKGAASMHCKSCAEGQWGQAYGGEKRAKWFDVGNTEFRFCKAHDCVECPDCLEQAEAMAAFVKSLSGVAAAPQGFPMVQRANGQMMPDMTKRAHKCEWQGEVRAAALPSRGAQPSLKDLRLWLSTAIFHARSHARDLAALDSEPQFSAAVEGLKKFEIVLFAGAAPPAASPQPRDGCQLCSGLSGGNPGNEHIVEGVTVCDYCSAKILEFNRLRSSSGSGTAAPSAPGILQCPNCGSKRVSVHGMPEGGECFECEYSGKPKDFFQWKEYAVESEEEKEERLAKEVIQSSMSLSDQAALASEEWAEAMRFDRALNELSWDLWKYESRSELLAELRRRLLPTLQALDQQHCSAECGHGDCLKIREVLKPWLTK